MQGSGSSCSAAKGYMGSFWRNLPVNAREIAKKPVFTSDLTPEPYKNPQWIQGVSHGNYLNKRNIVCSNLTIFESFENHIFDFNYFQVLLQLFEN